MTVTRGNADDLKRWVVRMTKDMAPERAKLLHQTVHIQASNGVIENTPVGNPDLWKDPPPPGYAGGRARGNWQSTRGASATGEVDRIDPSGAATAAAGQQVAAQIQAGEASYITNNVPYIERLNDGWSTQAPKGFVRAIIDRVAAQFKK